MPEIQKKITVFALSLITVISSFLLFSNTQAAPDAELTYHGKLTDTSNVAVSDGSYDFTLVIYDAETGGNCLWTSQGNCTTPTPKSLTVTNGIFSTTLGESGDNPLNLDFSENYYLGITIGSNAEMTPRRKVTPTGFALNSHRLNGQTEDYYLNTSANAQTKTGALSVNDDFTVNTNDLYVDTTNGRVGIGTDSPLRALTVQSPFQVTAEFKSTAAGGNLIDLIAEDVLAPYNAIRFRDASSNQGTVGYDATNDVMFFNYGGYASAEDIIIDSNSNVGIGTASPSYRLHVNSGLYDATALFESTDSNAIAYFKDSATTNNNGVGLGATGDELRFFAGTSATSERMRIDVDGNVGIGTSNPTTKLDVLGNVELDEYLYFNNGATDYLRHDGSTFMLSDNLLPSADDTYNLGSSTSRWQDLYLGPNSLHIGTDGDEGILSYNTTNDYFNFDQKIKSASSIQLGNDTDTCDATKEGAMRYNDTTKVMEFCNGTTWGSLASGESLPPCTDGQLLSYNDASSAWECIDIPEISESSIKTHTFTDAESWIAFDNLDENALYRVVLDTENMTAGIMNVYADDVLQHTVGLGDDDYNYFDIVAGDNITIESVSEGFTIGEQITFENNFSVATQEAAPQDLTFNTDGTKMYVVGTGTDEVNEYVLSTAFDISTAVFNYVLSVTAEEAAPTGIAFNSDGTKMFIAGSNGDEVNEYDLSIAWDVSTTVASTVFSVATEDTSPQAIRFNADGTKMFIVGNAGDDINEYSLSTGFDISTAVFNTNFSVAGQDDTPTGIAFNTDGTKMFVTGQTGVDINEYVLSTGFDISTAVHTFRYSVSGQEATIKGLTFSTDGTKVFIAGSGGVEVNEYSLATGFSFSPTMYDASFSVAAQDTAPRDVTFNDDGTIMYVIGGAGVDINIYDLSTAWDVTTAVYRDRFAVAEDATPRGLAFNTDGTKMFVGGSTADEINEYNLFAPWDPTTAVYDSRIDITTEDDNPQGFTFNPDGTRMYSVGATGDDINEYHLSVGFDISTATFDSNFSIATEEASPNDIAFNTDGTKMLILGANGDEVNEYDLSVAWDVSTAVFNSKFGVFAQDNAPTGIAFNTDGTKMYITGTQSDSVHEYDISPVTFTGTTKASVNVNSGSGGVSYTSLWQEVGSDIYYNAGSVGIGTASPSQELDVIGNIELDDYIYFNNSATDYLRHDGTTFVLSDDLLPSTTTLNLGSDTNRWQDLYLNGTSLHVGTSTTDEGVISYDTTNNIFNIETDATTAGDIAFNTDDLYIDTSTGQVGIGTNAPDSKFHVMGDESVIAGVGRATIGLEDIGSGEQWRIGAYGPASLEGGGNFGINESSISAVRFLIENDTGNIGIGTSDPDAKLHVQQETDASYGGMVITNIAGDANLGIYVDSSQVSHIGGANGSPEAINIENATGHVSINASSPSYRFQVGDKFYVDDSITTNFYDDATSDAPYTRVSADGFHTRGMGEGQLFLEGAAIDSNIPIEIGRGMAGGQSTQDVVIGDNYELFVATGVNNVGINTSVANSTLSVGGSGNASWKMFINGEGTTSSTYGLVIRPNGSTTNNFLIRDDGWGYLRNSTWAYGSDIRLKENIEGMDNYGLDTILSLDTYKFDYIDGSKDQLGFIAQDIEKIVPEAVSESMDGMLSLQTGFFTPILVNAVQEQNTLITTNTNDLTTKATAASVSDLQILVDEQLEEIATLLTSTEDEEKTLRDDILSLQTESNTQANLITSIQEDIDLIDQQQTVLSSLVSTHNDTIVAINENFLFTTDKDDNSTVTVNGILIADALKVKSIETEHFVINDDVVEENEEGEDVNAASVGTATILASELEVNIESVAITESSRVFVTARSESAIDASLTVTDVSDGKCVVGLPETKDVDVTFDWFIVGDAD